LLRLYVPVGTKRTRRRRRRRIGPFPEPDETDVSNTETVKCPVNYGPYVLPNFILTSLHCLYAL